MEVIGGGSGGGNDDARVTKVSMIDNSVLYRAAVYEEHVPSTCFSLRHVLGYLTVKLSCRVVSTMDMTPIQV